MEVYCAPFTVTLTSSYVAGSGTLSVSAAAPAAIQSGTFRVRLGNSSNTVLIVTNAGSGTTWNVSAEFNDANASSGTTVYGCEFSPGALTKIRSDFSGPNLAWSFDDFLAANTTGALGWTANGGGGGIYNQNGALDAANRPGNWNIQANSTNWEYLVLGPANAARNCYLSSAVGTTILSSSYAKAGGQSRFGWFNNTGQVTTDGVYFCYDATANGNSNWWAYSVSSNVVTKADTGVASTAWAKLEIDTAGSAATFKINDTQVATGTVPSGEIMSPGFMAYGTNSQQANIFIDWFAIQLNFNR